ncbi:hypothetical protein [Microbacterium sp. PRC9]|uniref:hypothetical protein n=1 Tax=Microbacterium sp. PRC9 TaxID=2962591 RepID=UPI0028826ADF|nr:hypothetical protein [Microbacterium sp. PRC9]MDT0143075.1 hypothetical protein [Microbacterium sp. PRC9]
MVTMATCSVDDCGGKVRGRGLCNAHLLRLQRYGDPLGGMHKNPNSYAAVHRRLRLERGRARLFECESLGCTRSADEWAWMGTGPEARELTRGVLIRYGTELADYATLCLFHHRKLDKGMTRAYCQRGHALTGSNVAFITRSSGKVERWCRECKRARDRASRAA